MNKSSARILSGGTGIMCHRACAKEYRAEDLEDLTETVQTTNGRPKTKSRRSAADGGSKKTDKQSHCSVHGGSEELYDMDAGASESRKKANKKC